MIDQLQWFAKAGAAVLRQRNLVVIAHVLNLFAAPNLTANLDNFAGSRYGSGIGKTVKAFDYLGARGAKAEHRATIGEVVQTGSGHG